MLTPASTVVKSLSLADVVAWIESRGRADAYRFEPKIFSHQPHGSIIDRIMATNNCNSSSAQVIYSSSYGLFQLMGFNIYSTPIAWDSTIFEFVQSVDAQRDAFWYFVREHEIDFTPQALLQSDNAKKFALLYNGSLDYVTAIVSSLAHFGVH